MSNQLMEILHHHLGSLRQYKVKQLALFGSYVRNEQHGESDIDMFVVFEEGETTFRNFMGLKLYLENLFDREVDLVTEKAIKENVLPFILKEAIYLEGL